MKIEELYTQLLDEALEDDLINISSHAPWMARLLIELPRDPGFAKLARSTREEIGQIVAALEQ